MTGELLDALLQLSPRWTVTGSADDVLVAIRQRGSETIIVARRTVAELVDRLLTIEAAEAAQEGDPR